MRRQRQKRNTAAIVVNGHIIRKIGRARWLLEVREQGHHSSGSKSKATSDAYTLEPGPYTEEDLN